MKKNEKNKVRAICKNAQCPWMVYASWLNDDCKTLKVKTVGPDHTCAMEVKNKFVTSNLIAKKYVHIWRSNPQWTFEAFAQQIRTDFSMWMHRSGSSIGQGALQGL